MDKTLGKKKGELGRESQWHQKTSSSVTWSYHQ